jgi:hypothetical protein
MQAVIEHKSGVIFSVKTFRPLWLFPWLSSVWRQFPMRTCVATVSYENKRAAEAGHRELVQLLQALEVGGKMAEPFAAIEEYAKKKTGAGVRSYRIYPGHAAEGKVTVKITPERKP